MIYMFFFTGERILDIATGTGMAALALAKAVGPDGSVVALDISHGALAQVALVAFPLFALT